MNRTTRLAGRRTIGRLGVLAVVASAVLAVAAGPAGAKGLNDERSPHITVVGAKLKPSNKMGSSTDPAIGKAAPTISGLSLGGAKLTFKNDGKPRVVLFLSHSCPHCQAEVPRLVQLQKQGKLDGVEFDTVATNTSKSLPNWPPSKWLKREHWPFSPVLADDGRLNAFFGFGGQAFPYFVFVGPDGKVVARAAGELPPSTVAAVVAKFAKGQSVFSKS
jgi:cytochrome c biogenesis protein CcmG, thiol:disulfide interchange protein DsbE